ncbi:MAG: hypothetical protein LBH94_05015, partial [Deltaproteobacteria bacterium]|nr:hypothetical protein [Deltaproteobacteria bacterium]
SALSLLLLLTSYKDLHPSQRSLFHVGGIPSRAVPSRPLDASAAPPILLFLPADRNDDRCGNSPLPCALSDDARLRLRVPGKLGGGFSRQ